MDRYKESTQRGSGIFKDPLTAGACHTEAGLCSRTIYDIMQPQLSVLRLLTLAFQKDLNKCSR